MRLTWRDAVATAGAAAVAAVYLLFLSGTELPIIDSVRGATATILVLGGATGCAMARPDMFNGVWTVTKRIFAAIAITLGVVALGAAVIALVGDAEVALAVFAVTVLALWLNATVRHLSTVADEPVLHEVR